MKKKLVLALIIMFMTLPLAALAASHEMNHESMKHEGMKHDDMTDHSKMDHDGMNMAGDMIMLSMVEADGIQASAHMKDIGKVMSQMGMDKTHHFMVKFVNAATGEAVESGSVALRVIDANGSKSEPVRLMPMAGQFGADITIGEGMMHTLEVGTKLPDGKKRQFEFMFHQM